MAHHFTLVEKGTPLEKASVAVLLLHGRGGFAADMLNLGRTLAPTDAYLAALQADNNTWYPYSFMAPVATNQPWLDTALDNARQWIEQVQQFMPSTQIYLIGFSQGACLALETAARFSRPFGGVVAFTGGLIGETIDPSPYQAKFAGSRIWMSNGDLDPHVPLIRNEESKQVLESLGATVNLAIYPGRPHTIITAEIQEAKEFIFVPNTH